MGGISLPISYAIGCYTAALRKRAWFSQRGSRPDQWDRAENLKQCSANLSLPDRDAKAIKWRKDKDKPSTKSALAVRYYGLKNKTKNQPQRKPYTLKYKTFWKKIQNLRDLRLGLNRVIRLDSQSTSHKILKNW